VIYRLCLPRISNPTRALSVCRQFSWDWQSSSSVCNLLYTFGSTFGFLLAYRAICFIVRLNSLLLDTESTGSRLLPCRTYGRDWDCDDPYRARGGYICYSNQWEVGFWSTAVSYIHIWLYLCTSYLFIENSCFIVNIFDTYMRKTGS
jgi:hypothetical protein